MSPNVTDAGKGAQGSSKDVPRPKVSQTKVKSQKHHYHIPHFSSRLSDGKLTPPLSSSSTGFSLRSTPSPRPSRGVVPPNGLAGSQNHFTRKGRLSQSKSRVNSSTMDNSQLIQGTPVQKLMQDRNLEADLLIEKQLLSLQDELQNRSVSSELAP